MSSVAISVPPLSRRSLGAFYTPSFVADWLASELGHALGSSANSMVIDPACGDGELLHAVKRSGAFASPHLVGIDVDAHALALATERLGEDTTLIHADSLTVRIDGLLGRTADALIANPPWGAELAQSATAYREAGLTVARGQFDSYDLFVEKALGTVRTGGIIGLVLPDSLLLPEHEATRRLLLRHTQLLSLVRLGEGIFPGVFRGTILLVARRGAASHDALVRCARLRFDQRRELLRSVAGIDELLQFHDVPQRRFAANPRAEFDLDVRDEEAAFFRMAERSGFPWDGLVRWSRGVEIGKGGRVWRCSVCRTARPVPHDARRSCGECGAVLGPANAEVIVRPPTQPSPGWEPLIVGSDVTRYSVRPTREILVGVPGIRYKTIDAAHRLLVRKTGVGIQAAIDDGRSHTTQTVFQCTASPSASYDALGYLLGVFNSRPMQAFHLRHTGDHEWRSHPYVTPRTLRSLPIPDPTESPRTKQLAVEIAALARRMGLHSTPSIDSALDDLVLDLYGLGEAGRDWARNVLVTAQQLQSISSLLASESFVERNTAASA